MITLFFGVPKVENLMNLKKVFNDFCIASGLKVNLSISSLLGINLEEGIREYAGALGCSKGEWLIKYLGVPLGGKHEIFL